MKETIEKLLNHSKENREVVALQIKPVKKEFETLLDLEAELFNNHFPFVLDPYYGLQEFEKISFQAFHKAHNLTITAYQLLLDGNYGACNILVRAIFEYLLIGKFFSKRKDITIAQKWIDGSQFDVYEKIIKKMDKRHRVAFHTFWRISCSDNHAMASSFQIFFDASKNVKEINESMGRLILLNVCLYHLVGSNIINRRLAYRSEYFGSFKARNSEIKIAAREIIRKIEKYLLPAGKQFIRYYCQSWTIN